jgi:hypothetical protein
VKVVLGVSDRLGFYNSIEIMRLHRDIYKWCRRIDTMAYTEIKERNGLEFYNLIFPLNFLANFIISCWERFP